MTERRITGGSKEFSYSKEDLHRIRTTDTASTKAFKQAYNDYRMKRGDEKVEQELKRERRKLLLIAIGLGIAAIALIIISFMQ